MGSPATNESLHIRVEWKRRPEGGILDPRKVVFPGGATLSGNGDEGEEAFVTPDELFLAAISTAQMHTYIDLSRRSGIVVLSYRDEAYATSVPNRTGQRVISSVVLRPRITFETHESPTFRAMAIRLVHEAQDVCSIQGTIKATIEVEPLLIWS